MSGASTEQLILMLRAATLAAWHSSFSGNSEWLRDRYEWFQNPQPGDLVIETSTVFQSPLLNSIGYLISVGYEPYFSDEEWEKVKDRYDNKNPQTKIWRIRLLLDGTECKWDNANFVRVVDDIHEFNNIGRKY